MLESEVMVKPEIRCLRSRAYGRSCIVAFRRVSAEYSSVWFVLIVLDCCTMACSSDGRQMLYVAVVVVVTNCGTHAFDDPRGLMQKWNSATVEGRQAVVDQGHNSCSLSPSLMTLYLDFPHRP
jgi:hypothetical protein